VIDNETSDSQNRLIIPFSSLVISPDAIDKKALEALGAREIRQFHGVCELAHYQGFEASDVLGGLGLDQEKGRVIVARAEPFFASYCTHHSKLLKVLEGLAERTECRIVFIPRNQKDREAFQGVKGITIPDRPIDTLSLYKSADLMIGAGGSMNREACIAGCPAISLYPESLLAVDRFLIEKGVMKHTLDEKEAIGLALDVLGNGKAWKARLRKARKGLENPHELILKEIKKLA
jgi:predicted glycosyltransferase